jgi:hypothetical protein
MKPKCPKCGSKKVSFVPANVYVVTSQEELTSRAPLEPKIGLQLPLWVISSH